MSLALKNVSLCVDGQTHIYDTTVELVPSGFNVLLGTTLAGKTTLMRLMAGLVPPTSGAILFNGVDVTGVPVQKRNVSMVYQQFINYPNMNVFDNIASPLKLAGLTRADIRQRVQQVAELLRLDPFLKRRPAELSGGQQQRAAVARAVAGKPAILLADEPTGNLDSKSGESVMELLAELHREGSTICMVTHDPRYAEHAMKSIQLFDGQIVRGETRLEEVAS